MVAGQDLLQYRNILLILSGVVYRRNTSIVSDYDGNHLLHRCMDQSKIFASVLQATEHEQHSVNERAWIMGSPNLRSYFTII